MFPIRSSAARTHRTDFSRADLTALGLVALMLMGINLPLYYSVLKGAPRQTGAATARSASALPSGTASAQPAFAAGLPRLTAASGALDTRVSALAADPVRSAR